MKVGDYIYVQLLRGRTVVGQIEWLQVPAPLKEGQEPDPTSPPLRGRVIYTTMDRGVSHDEFLVTNAEVVCSEDGKLKEIIFTPVKSEVKSEEKSEEAGEKDFGAV